MILKIRGAPTNEHKRLTKSGDMRICGWIARVQSTEHIQKKVAMPIA